MICLSKRTVLFCCVLVVTLASVAGRKSDTNDEFVPRAKTRYHQDKEKLLPKDCGIENPVDKINGGAITDIDEHPWMALLIYNSAKGTQHICGGALISKRYILTSALCLSTKEWTRTDVKIKGVLKHVVLGAWNISSWKDCPPGEGGCDPPHQKIEVEKIIKHEMYSKDSHQHDIGLIRLKRDAQFNDFVKPICLPLTNELKQSVRIGEELDIVGWGTIETRGIPGVRAANVKHKVSVPVVSTAKCADIYRTLKRPRDVGTAQLCAGGIAGSGSCSGDTGGPLMGMRGDTWIVFGISSYGRSTCGMEGWPDVYTRVGSYTDWILSKLQP